MDTDEVTRVEQEVASDSQLITAGATEVISEPSATQQSIPLEAEGDNSQIHHIPVLDLTTSDDDSQYTYSSEDKPHCPSPHSPASRLTVEYEDSEEGSEDECREDDVKDVRRHEPDSADTVRVSSDWQANWGSESTEPVSQSEVVEDELRIPPSESECEETEQEYLHRRFLELRARRYQEVQDPNPLLGDPMLAQCSWTLSDDYERDFVIPSPNTCRGGLVPGTVVSFEKLQEVPTGTLPSLFSHNEWVVPTPSREWYRLVAYPTSSQQSQPGQDEGDGEETPASHAETGQSASPSAQETAVEPTAAQDDVESEGSSSPLPSSGVKTRSACSSWTSGLTSPEPEWSTLKSPPPRAWSPPSEVRSPQSEDPSASAPQPLVSPEDTKSRAAEPDSQVVTNANPASACEDGRQFFLLSEIITDFDCGAVVECRTTVDETTKPLLSDQDESKDPPEDLDNSVGDTLFFDHDYVLRPALAGDSDCVTVIEGSEFLELDFLLEQFPAEVERLHLLVLQPPRPGVLDDAPKDLCETSHLELKLEQPPQNLEVVGLEKAPQNLQVVVDIEQLLTKWEIQQPQQSSAKVENQNTQLGSQRLSIQDPDQICCKSEPNDLRPLPQSVVKLEPDINSELENGQSSGPSEPLDEEPPNPSQFPGQSDHSSERLDGEPTNASQFAGQSDHSYGPLDGAPLNASHFLGQSDHSSGPLDGEPPNPSQFPRQSDHSSEPLDVEPPNASLFSGQSDHSSEPLDSEPPNPSQFPGQSVHPSKPLDVGPPNASPFSGQSNHSSEPLDSEPPNPSQFPGQSDHPSEPLDGEPPNASQSSLGIKETQADEDTLKICLTQSDMLWKRSILDLTDNSISGGSDTSEYISLSSLDLQRRANSDDMFDAKSAWGDSSSPIQPSGVVRKIDSSPPRSAFELEPDYVPTATPEEAPASPAQALITDKPSGDMFESSSPATLQANDSPIPLSGVVAVTTRGTAASSVLTSSEGVSEAEVFSTEREPARVQASIAVQTDSSPSRSPVFANLTRRRHARNRFAHSDLEALQLTQTVAMRRLDSLGSQGMSWDASQGGPGPSDAVKRKRGSWEEWYREFKTMVDSGKRRRLAELTHEDADSNKENVEPVHPAPCLDTSAIAQPTATTSTQCDQQVPEQAGLQGREAAPPPDERVVPFGRRPLFRWSLEGPARAPRSATTLPPEPLPCVAGCAARAEEAATAGSRRPQSPVPQEDTAAPGTSEPPSSPILQLRSVVRVGLSRRARPPHLHRKPMRN